MFDEEEELPDINEFDEQEETSSIIRDKIFDNTFDESEMDVGDFNFKVDPSMEQKSYEQTLDETMIFKKFEELIIESKFTKFNFFEEGKGFKKMNKSDINEVYSFITSNLSEQPRIEIFSIICNYFDISPEKFYESLSNSFKTELITELKSRGYLQKNKSLF
jgi:hypothetical protein